MNTLKAAKLVRRSMLPLAIVVIVWVYLSIRLLRVPEGMDTMTGTHPEGSLCLIDKRSSAVQVGTVVFVDAFGGTVLTRVLARHDGFIEVRHDNPLSQLPSGNTFASSARQSPWPRCPGNWLDSFTLMTIPL